jgi:hypothetical protein
MSEKQENSDMSPFNCSSQNPKSNQKNLLKKLLDSPLEVKSATSDVLFEEDEEEGGKQRKDHSPSLFPNKAQKSDMGEQQKFKSFKADGVKQKRALAAHPSLSMVISTPIVKNCQIKDNKSSAT